MERQNREWFRIETHIFPFTGLETRIPVILLEILFIRIFSENEVFLTFRDIHWS